MQADASRGTPQKAPAASPVRQQLTRMSSSASSGTFPVGSPVRMAPPGADMSSATWHKAVQDTVDRAFASGTAVDVISALAPSLSRGDAVARLWAVDIISEVVSRLRHPVAGSPPGTGRPSRSEEDSGSEATIPPPELQAEIADLPPPADSEVAELKVKAFRYVVSDKMAELDAVLSRLPLELWSNWENKAGKDLITLSEERGSSGAYSVLAKKLGLVQDRKKESFEERESVWIFRPGEVQPLRATVLEDTPEEVDDVLVEYWDGDDPPSRVEKCMVRKLWS